MTSFETVILTVMKLSKPSDYNDLPVDNVNVFRIAGSYYLTNDR